MAEREKGVATVPCSECGHNLAMEEQADGSLAAVRCSHCHPIKERAEKREHREKATNVGSNQATEEQK